jgi:hypothetical protein
MRFSFDIHPYFVIVCGLFKVEWSTLRWLDIRAVARASIGASTDFL